MKDFNELEKLEKLSKALSEDEESVQKLKNKMPLIIIGVVILAVIIGAVILINNNKAKQEEGKPDTIYEDGTEPESADTAYDDNSDVSEEIREEDLIVDDDKMSISIADYTYIQDASPITIEFDVYNHSKNALDFYLDSVSVDGRTIAEPSELEDSPILVGDLSVYKYIDLEVLQEAGVSDFKNVDFDVVVGIGGEEYARKHVQLKRSDFREE